MGGRALVLGAFPLCSPLWAGLGGVMSQRQGPEKWSSRAEGQGVGDLRAQ